MLYIANVGVNRRVMKVKHLPVEMTLSSARIWQTFAQYFPPGT